MTPRDQYQRRTPMNNNYDPRMNYPPEQYQRTPSDMQRMTPRDQYQRRTPLNNNYDPRMEYPPEQYQRRTPSNMQRMTPQQEYQRGTPNDPRDQYDYQNNVQNQMRMSPKQQYQYENGNPEMDPRLNYRRSPTYNPQRNPNGTPYNQRPTPNNNYNMRNSPYNDNYPMRTPQPQYNQNKAQMEYNNEYNMRGSRTPFIDYKTGQNVYSKRGFTPGQNQYNDIPNRPPSRPFGDISFKGQQNGGDNYQRYNNPNQNNYY
jgi:hypothetical protein